MTAAREEVLGRIRSALATGVDVPSVPREYRQAGAPAADIVDLFCRRAADYLATVTPVAPDRLEAALAEACARRGTRSIVTAPGAPWRVAELAMVADSAGVPATELDGYDAALTGCALAIAETGTVVLDGAAASGRRALTLVPDHHLCVVDAAQIVSGVPDAIGALAPAAEEGRPITFVSGPSATSDVELERVEGVHGPRLLDIFVVRA
jgi:L-lactate dehydrogenase complex protein LldG